jgi:hypothetical protein|tara:strand:- start:416 stop:1081 length:666 start_codon:yes stop_codon:yes gene_type:complete
LKKILYTTIFGGYDDITTPKLPRDWDWKCFTEKNSIPLYSDNTRNAKKFKILPHRYLQDYEYSIFIDGNMYVVGNVDELIEKYLNDSNIAFFDHNKNIMDPRDCIYDEYNAIINLGKNDPNQNYKDDPQTMYDQVKRYQDEGYPSHNGLITGMVILRRHNEKDCIRVMEDWWTEIKYGSKRDQLSFNYVAWKNKTKFNYMEGDSRNNEYFTRDTKPHKGSK